MRRLNYLATVTLTLSVSLAYGQRYSSFVLRQLDTTDSIAKFLDLADIRTTVAERQKHKLVWTINEVRTGAIALRKQNIPTFTMTDETPTDKSPFYIIGFYEMMDEHYVRLLTYRVSKDLKIEKYNLKDDNWTSVKLDN